MSSTTQLELRNESEVDVIADVMEKCIGQVNRWQVCVFLLVFLVNVPLSMQELAIVFLAPQEDFSCSDETLDKCSDYCPEHVFDKSQFIKTIGSQWDMVCGRAWLTSFSQAVLMSGVLTGHVIFGILADKYGRRKPLVFAVIMEAVIGAGIAFSPELWVFMLLRFLVAVAAGGSLVSCFVMVVEIIGKDYRPHFAILFQMTYYIGHSMLGILAYFLRDWRTLQLSISIPTIVLISYYWLLPESPRWLLLTGQRNEAIKIMEKAQIFNRKPLNHIKTTVRTMVLQEARKEHFLDLFKTSHIRMTTFIIYFNWIVLGLSFFGVAQLTGKLSGNIYRNVILSGLIQIPGNGILLYMINKQGRKFCAMSTYLLCAIALIALAFVPKEPAWIITALGCTGMMAISLAFATIFLWTGELFPTVVRNIGLGTSAVCAKLGSMVAPLISDLYKFYPWLPSAVFGSATLLAFLVCINLPETLDSVMPDTIEQAEEFGRRRRSSTR